MPPHVLPHLLLTPLEGEEDVRGVRGRIKTISLAKPLARLHLPLRVWARYMAQNVVPSARIRVLNCRLSDAHDVQVSMWLRVQSFTRTTSMEGGSPTPFQMPLKLIFGRRLVALVAHPTDQKPAAIGSHILG